MKILKIRSMNNVLLSLRYNRCLGNLVLDTTLIALDILLGTVRLHIIFFVCKPTSFFFVFVFVAALQFSIICVFIVVITNFI